MPTKRAILAQLTAKELRTNVDRYDLYVDDRRVKSQLVAALAGARKARLDELLPELFRNRLKELCGAFSLDDSGRKKADLVARLLAPAPVLKIDRGQAPPAVSRPVAETPVPPAETQGATTGHEAELWRMADALRGSMDAAEYKHVVLGLIFLKYISDAFEEMHARLEDEQHEGADPEDPDEYRAENIFWVPPEARWSHLKAQAKQPVIGRLVDDAMAAIERDNSVLKDVLPKDYARPALDKQRLGQIIDMISNIRVGDADARSKDVLGRVYEYFLSQFASAEGKKGGEFYTPRCIVKLLVEMLEPYRGRVYDPCCGSSGMFVQSVEFIRAHATGNGNGGKARGDISVYGQESNYTTWRLAKMNLAIRGIEGQIAHGDSFHNDRHPDLRADFILANSPFNVSDWGGERLTDDKRWQCGVPPKGNANFAWVQHIVHHLAPAGAAGFVLANGSMSSAQSGEGEIRKNLIEADLVDCMVALPGQLFYSTQIPACLWFLARDRRDGRFRDRRGEVLFIDARTLGRMVDRTHRELTDEDREPFEDKMKRLVAQLRGQQDKAAELDAAIAANLEALGFSLRDNVEQ